MIVSRREFIAGLLATGLAISSEVVQTATAKIATTMTPAIFLPFIVKAGDDNRLWVECDNAIVYLDLVVETCTSNQCVIRRG